MAADSKIIKVKSLEFTNPPFRKLGNLKIDFADRLTLIAGHNGIGKSTILGLVANTFGVPSSSSPKSYFGEAFSANIERIVYLALEEVAKVQEHPGAAPVVSAAVGERQIRKRCSMTKRGEWRRARVVPRTIDKAEDDPIGQDAKIPLPTIYLGMKRLASIGEADEKEVDSSLMDMEPEDKELMADFVRSIILGSEVTTNITHLSIRGSKKKTAQPGYENHDALAVSMGQDSLASIATALASFNRLKRDLGDEYVGGLLIIDELDVGFHPHAIDRLAKNLKRYARNLDLQIIATTHSPRLIEAIHPDGEGNPHLPDAVLYLLDTKRPRIAEDQSLSAILDDMALRDSGAADTKTRKPTLCVYFEDPEGKQFCDILVPPAKKAALGRKYGVTIKLLPLGVGGSNLVKLPEHDPIFKDRVLVVDADTIIPKKTEKRGNTIKLPCPKGASGTNRSPENVIKNFLISTAKPDSKKFDGALLEFGVKNVSSDRIQNTFFSDGSGNTNQREGSKNWWVTHWDKISKWNVIQVWAKYHQDEVKSFLEAFETAIAGTSKRLGPR